MVPTLVDHEAGEVIADSRLILLHAAALSGGCLLPEASREMVLAEVDAVDRLPHAGLFYGANPDGDHRPPPIQAGMKDAHLRKIEQARARMDGLPDGSPLRAAYEHKLRKEEAGRAFIADPANMRSIIEDTRALIEAFDRRLAERRGPWVAPEGFTLADVAWSVSLFRLLYLGYGWMWDELAYVPGYVEAAFDHPSVRAGAIRWPGHPPGETVAHLLS